MNDTNEKVLEEKLKGIIAETIGVDGDDINLEDRFTEELHMSATELSDLVMSVSETFSVDATKIDILDLDSVDNLLEILEQENAI